MMALMLTVVLTPAKYVTVNVKHAIRLALTVHPAEESMASTYFFTITPAFIPALMAHTEKKVQTLVKHVLKDACYAMGLHCRTAPSVTQHIMVPLRIINILEKIPAR